MGYGAPTPSINALAGLRLEAEMGAAAVLRGTPVGRGYADVGASLSLVTGPQVWAELGYRPLERMSIFSRAYANPGDAGVLAGLHFDL